MKQQQQQQQQQQRRRSSTNRISRNKHHISGPAGELHTNTTHPTQPGNNKCPSSSDNNNNTRNILEQELFPCQSQSCSNNNNSNSYSNNSSTSLTNCYNNNNNNNNNNSSGLSLVLRNSSAWSACCISLGRYVDFPMVVTMSTTSSSTTNGSNDYNNNNNSYILQECLSFEYTTVASVLQGRHDMMCIGNHNNNNMNNHIHNNNDDSLLLLLSNCPNNSSCSGVDKFLVVYVYAVQCHTHCDWTCELRDESSSLSSSSSSSIQGWVEQNFRNNHPDAVRPGTVLLLRNCSIAGFPGEYNNGIEINQMMNKKKNEEEEIVVVPSEEDEKQVERMLLIGEDTVVYVWVPDEACVISADEKAKLMRERQKVRERIYALHMGLDVNENVATVENLLYQRNNNKEEEEEKMDIPKPATQALCLCSPPKETLQIVNNNVDRISGAMKSLLSSQVSPSSKQDNNNIDTVLHHSGCDSQIDNMRDEGQQENQQIFNSSISKEVVLANYREARVLDTIIDKDKVYSKNESSVLKMTSKDDSAHDRSLLTSSQERSESYSEREIQESSISSMHSRNGYNYNNRKIRKMLQASGGEIVCLDYSNEKSKNVPILDIISDKGVNESSEDNISKLQAPTSSNLCNTAVSLRKKVSQQDETLYFSSICQTSEFKADEQTSRLDSILDGRKSSSIKPVSSFDTNSKQMSNLKRKLMNDSSKNNAEKNKLSACFIHSTESVCGNINILNALSRRSIFDSKTLNHPSTSIFGGIDRNDLLDEFDEQE